MSLVDDYIVALANLYGIVHKDKVVEIYNEQNDEKIQGLDFNEEELEKSRVFLQKDYFMTKALMPDMSIEEELELREGKPFYVPDREELLRYRKYDYFEETPEYRRLFRFVRDKLLNGDSHKALLFCVDVQSICKIEFSPQMISTIIDLRGIVFDSEYQIKKLFELIVDLSNNTRLWENNGYTPEELSRLDDKAGAGSSIRKTSRRNSSSRQSATQRRVKKIGRNDPCPCGSGKKYKKCCLGKDEQ